MRTFDDFLQEEMSKYSVEIWDKQSPINGRPAELFKQQPDYHEDGVVLLCYYNGNLAYVQMFHPFGGGAIREDELDTLIPSWIRVLAEPAAKQAYEEYLKEQEAQKAKQWMEDLEAAVAYVIGNLPS